MRAGRDTLVSVTQRSARHTVTIPLVTTSDMAIHDTLDVMLTSTGGSIAAFKLKLGLESPFLDIDTILRGELCDSCHWQFFNSRSINTANKPNSPLALWQAVAIARSNPVDTTPVCYGLSRTASILRVVVSTSPLAQIKDTVVPIFFFWEDCSDNTFSNVSGDTLMLAARVIDFNGRDLQSENNVFPSHSGGVEQCIKPGRKNPPLREIEFRSGGVIFKLDVGQPLPDSSSLQNK
ncbi:MAG TPA: hypothetical protein VN285_05365 [Candidatus Deferrimicrobium sp.]|nr:hypothetical protein [Candidatus Deferrimicrobium sp.]